MSSMYPYHVAIFSANALGAFLVAAILWKRRHISGGFCLFLLMIAAGMWAFSSAMEFSAIDTPHKLFWSKISYLSIPYAGPLWFLFIMQYLGRDRWFTPGRIALLFAIPVCIMLLALTNDLHGFLWPSITPVSAEPGAMLVYAHGPGVWAIVNYSYALMLIGTVYLISGVLRFQNLYRRQVIALIISVVLPWIGNFLYLSGALAMPGLDTTPFAFTASGATLAFSVFRYHFLDLVPVARHTLFENMRHSVVVLDAEERLIDFNPAARNLLGLADTHIGESAIGASWPLTAVLTAFAKNGEIVTEHIVELPESGRTLHVTFSPFKHHRHAAGRVLVLQDITAQRHLEQERKEIGDSLEKALSDITTLQRLIPICSHCKKIRTDEGFWLQVENYFAENTDVVFSHGICPECIEKYYGWVKSPKPETPENGES